jgi:heme exporter protein A
MSESSPFKDRPSLHVERLSAARGGRVLFEDLNFAAAPGDFVEIRGANGAGKTTLLRTLAFLAKAFRGTVHFANAGDAPELSLHLIGHRDGLKPSADAQAHLRYWTGLLGGSEAAISPALDRVGLAAIAHLPARALSQGQAQRLSLARLLVAPRPVWLLDEPAASLDMNGRALLSDMITAHRAGGGIVLAAVTRHECSWRGVSA